MTVDAKALTAAHRNLAQRIGKLILKIEKEAREPTPWEAHFASIALKHLEFSEYPPGEDAIFKADSEHIYNAPVHPIPLPADACKATAVELRERLAGLYEDL